MGNLKAKNWHQLLGEAFLQLLRVTSTIGLSADKVQRRQKESGPNQVTARRGTSAWLKYLQQLNQPLVYILLVAVDARI